MTLRINRRHAAHFQRLAGFQVAPGRGRVWKSIMAVNSVWTRSMVSALWLCRHLKGDTPMDNRTARNKEVSDRAKKLEAQIMGLNV